MNSIPNLYTHNDKHNHKYGICSSRSLATDKPKIILCTPSGKAAFLIGGVTCHTAFALPVTQFNKQMPELSSDIANTIREHFFY